MKEIKKIDVLSLAKFMAIFYAIFGFFWGLMGAFLVAPFASLYADAGMSVLLGAGIGLASIIVAPIVMGIVGFVLGAIVAFLYNLIAERFGGVQLDI